MYNTTTKYSILLQNIVFYLEKIILYYKMWYFTTECGNSVGYTITNSLLQSYHKILYFTTKCDIIPQSVAFLLQSVVIPMNYLKTNCSIVLQNIIVYLKNTNVISTKILDSYYIMIRINLMVFHFSHAIKS